MSSYFKVLDTGKGQVYVLTKRRWLFIIPMPHTSVMPRKGANLKRLGIFIKRTTDDPAMLATLHDAIVRLIEEVGISALAEIANNTKMTERVWKTFGGAGSGLHEIIKQSAQDGVGFPVPVDILKYIKGFM